MTSDDAAEDTEPPMGGIGVVLNPRSRRNLRDPKAAERLAALLGPHGVVRSAGSLDELAAIADEYRARAIDVLAICGGDGTNTVTLTGFLAAYKEAPLPPVALLRGGTMNTVARSIGVRPEAPEALLRDLVRAYAVGGARALSTVQRRVLCVTPHDGGAPHYGFLFGTGVMHGFLAEYYSAGEPTPLVAAQTLLRGIGSAFVGGPMIRRMAEPLYGSASLDDGTCWDLRNYLAIAAGTVEHVGLSFKPFYRYAERVGSFHALGIYASPTAFVAELPRVLSGVPMRRGRAYDVVTARMVVSCARGPLRYMVDGDLHEALPEGKTPEGTTSLHPSDDTLRCVGGQRPDSSALGQCDGTDATQPLGSAASNSSGAPPNDTLRHVGQSAPDPREASHAGTRGTSRGNGALLETEGGRVTISTGPEVRLILPAQGHS